MEILERYLHAIEFWLPKAQRRDIMAELSEDIYSQIEEKQDQLGRQLTEAEGESLIKQRGSPLQVATRYLPQQFLIGPTLYPVYVFVLRMAAVYLSLAGAIFIVSQRFQHPGINWATTIAATVSWLWTVAFTTVGVITISFVVLQRVEARTRFLEENWSPRRLPPVRNVKQISRLGSAIEVLVHLVALVWWIGWAWSPDIFGVRFTFTPVWVYFFWGFLLMIVANTALSAVNLIKPYWTVARALCRLAIDAVGSTLFCWLLQANVIASLSIVHVEASRALQIRDAIHSWLSRMFPFALVFVLVMIAIDLYRVIRVNRKSMGVSREAITVWAVWLQFIAVP